MFKFIKEIIQKITGASNKCIELELIKKKIINEINSESMDKILELLLDGMKILFTVDKDFRNNINGFNANYAFISQDGKISLSAIFKKSSFFNIYTLNVCNEAQPNPDAKLIFKDGKSIAELLLSPNPDIFNAILENKFNSEGNLSYILKFAYMSRHIAYSFGLVK